MINIDTFINSRFFRFRIDLLVLNKLGFDFPEFLVTLGLERVLGMFVILVVVVNTSSFDLRLIICAKFHDGLSFGCTNLDYLLIRLLSTIIFTSLARNS